MERGANNRAVSTPRVPPEIAKKIAAMKPAAPVAAPRPAPAPPPGAPRAPTAAAAPKPAAPRPASSIAGKLAAAGWLLALAAIAVAVAEFYYFEDQKAGALAEQAAGYEARIQQLQAEAALVLKKLQDDATAAQQVLQTELDFQKMPELPLKTVFRPGQVLYVENESDKMFACKVRLFRPSTSASREIDWNIKARTFQDLAAMDTWMFARYDKIEFVKSGYKPRSLEVP